MGCVLKDLGNGIFIRMSSSKDFGRLQQEKETGQSRKIDPTKSSISRVYRLHYSLCPSFLGTTLAYVGGACSACEKLC